jgi:hypothetical protein
MIVWTLHGKSGSTSPARFQKLFDTYKELWENYVMHLQKMAENKANVIIKNPQLRLPENKFCSEERYFGFRQCSFHSHRAQIGEGTCPHSLARTDFTLSLWPRTEEEMSSDETEASDKAFL